MTKSFQRLPQEKQTLIIEMCLKEFSKKTYQEANTDIIVNNSGISKGSLYYYFRNKRELYLYLLRFSLDKLTKGNDYTLDELSFYELIKQAWSSKLNQMKQFPLEIAFINNAAKDRSGEIYSEKESLLEEYYNIGDTLSQHTIKKALLSCELKPGLDVDFVVRGISLYLNSVIMDYLKQYTDKPMMLFTDSSKIIEEIEQYLQLFLKGVVANDGGRLY